MPRTWCKSGIGVALIAALLLDGCALMMTQQAPPNHETLTSFECDTSYGPAIADTFWTLGFAAFATAIQTQRDEFGETPLPWGPYIAGILVWTGLFGTSAFLGYSRATECQNAKERLEARLTGAPE
jgi:hypothetical protein